MRQILMTIFCLVASILVSAQAANTGKKPTPQQQTPGKENGLLAFLGLESIQKALSSVVSPADSGQLRSPDTPQAPPLNPTKADFVNLYNALAGFKVSKGAYTEALHLYVSGRENDKLTNSQLEDREIAYLKELARLKQHLQEVQKAFEPLRISLTFSSQETSSAIEDYLWGRGGQAVRASFLDTLTTEQCRDLYKQAVANNVLLDKAVARLFEYIQKTYPDIGHSS